MSTPLLARDILTVLQRQGLRNTQPRRVVAEGLAHFGVEGQDFSVQDLWDVARQGVPTLGRATVYRLVDVLVSDGLLDRVLLPDGTHRYRLCREEQHHHHLRCNSCWRVVEIDACLPPEVFDAVADSTDFAIDSHSLELYGRCSDCRDESPSPNNPRR